MLGFAWVKGVSGDGGGQDQGKCPRALQFAPRAASVRASASFLRGGRREKKMWGSRGWGRGEGRGGGGRVVVVAVRWDPLAAASTSTSTSLPPSSPRRLLRLKKGPWVASGSISAWKPHTHKALKAALMPRLGISYLLARLIIPPSTGARERRHRGWAGEIRLHSLNWTGEAR